MIVIAIFTVSCPAGSFYSEYLTCSPCPGGSFSSAAGMTSCKSCPLGSYSVAGSTACELCPAGEYSSVVGISCQSCPLGSYSTAGSTSCSPCPGNHFGKSIGGPSVCQMCPDGKFSSSGSSSCATCPIAYYSFSGGDCLWCGAQSDPSLKFNASLYHWTGGPTKQQCYCEPGYTESSNCKDNDCERIYSIPGISLGSLLFNSDTNLRTYTSSIGNISSVPRSSLSQNQLDQLNSAYSYLHYLLTVEVDINGDGNVSLSEMQNAIQVRSVSIFDISSYPVWCKRAAAGSLCYKLVVSVSSIYTDALSNFATSLKHTFDGSGVPVIDALTSTYPSPSWPISTCKSYDQAQFPYSYRPVTTSWVFRISNSFALKSHCAYDVSTGMVLSYSNSSTVDNRNSIQLNDSSPISTTNSFKRLYCIAVVYSSNITSFISYECTVGLAYVSKELENDTRFFTWMQFVFQDGTPIDLKPSLSLSGVDFEYLDTSSTEKEVCVFSK